MIGNKEIAETIFEEIKNAIYHPEKPVDTNALPDEFRKVSLGMEQLRIFLLENKEFAEAMAKGRLDAEPPGIENVIAAPLKEIQGNLRHITWLTKQVAKGDYSQELSHMAEFSNAFNTMTRELASSRTQMQKMVERDDLTGLYNRKYIMWYLGILEDEKRPFSIAFIDLDGLKFTNDTYGHDAGDFYIKAATAVLIKHLGKVARLSRIGGDEFLVVSETTESDSLVSLLREAREEFQNIGQNSQFQRALFHFSFGCCDMDYEKYDSASLIQRADELMYLYKQEYYRSNNITR
ncbi:MAG: GGDEF domain-containing protein [Clostridia bacterium]|nr:GGDEF domain-containing protein [Clostridia bacterium]